VSPETGLARFSPCGAVGVGLAAIQPSSAVNVAGHISHLVTRAGVREFSMQLQQLIWTGAVIAALAAAHGATADENSSAAVTQSEVVVTATRTATTVDDLAVPVIVITRDEIEHALAGDLASLLIGRSGIEISRNGGPGQPASIFMRGTDSDHTTVLIDGVRINPGTIGGAPLQNIQPESIERIEIVKGARSSLYGTDAIGGVINIITRAGAAPGASLYVSDGRYDTQVVAADASGMLGQHFGAGASYAYQRSDGFPPVEGSNNPGNYRNQSANAQLRYVANDALTWRAQMWRASGTSAYSESGFPAKEDFLDASYAVGADWQGGAGTHAKLIASRTTADVDQRLAPDFDRTNRDAIDAQYSWRAFPTQEWTVGTVVANEHTQTLSFGLPYDVHTHTTLAFAQDQWQQGANDLLLAVGYNHHETFGSHTTWNLEFGHAFNPQWRTTLAVGTAFHAPDSTDLYGYGGNTALKPEVSRQGQLGLQWHPTGTQYLRLSAFENDIDNLIDYVLIDPVNFVYKTENVERSRIRGAELEYEWQGAAWQVHSNYTLQDPQNLTTGQQLLRRSRENFTFAAQYDQGPLDFSAGLQLAGPRTDYVGFELGTVGGYTLVNLGVGYQLAQQWSVQLRLDNALDRHYELVSGYNTAGRSVTLAMRFHLR
jgi:vitamin B12 transporter